MSIEVVDNLARFQELKNPWQRLAGDHPFLNWFWLQRWWEQFGAQHQLQIVVIHRNQQGQDDGIELIAPLYFERNLLRGASLRWLGSGRASSDYNGLIMGRQGTDASIQQLVDWLLHRQLLDNSGRDEETSSESRPTEHASGCPAWSMIEIDGVAGEDPSVRTLIDKLAEGQAGPFDSIPVSIWKAELRDNFDRYVREVVRSSHRRRLRKLKKNWIDTERSSLSEATTHKQVDRFFDHLVALHTDRRRELDDPGCFEDSRMTAFLRQVCHDYLDNGNLRLSCLELDGEAVAYGLGFVFQQVHYIYQAGISQSALEHSPGFLLNIHVIQNAIAHGDTHIDFLRGDERYKSELGGIATPCHHYRIFAPTLAAALRGGLYRTKGSLRRMAQRLGISRG